jgi:hypothetical protein
MKFEHPILLRRDDEEYSCQTLEMLDNQQPFKIYIVVGL